MSSKIDLGCGPRGGRLLVAPGARKLYLSDKKLTDLPDAIGSLASLTELNVSSNQLTKLPAAIDSLAALTSLDLTNNQLTELPDAVGSLAALTRLDVTNNQLTELPATIGALTALAVLRVGKNKLTKLPDAIGSLAALTSLDLTNNQLTELPDAVGSLSALTRLDVTNNQLTELPAATIGALTTLAVLRVGKNELTELPDAIGSLAALTSLDLNNNQLTELPDAIGSLAALTSLDLTNNQLTKLPDAVGSLAALTRLDVLNNQLTELPDAVCSLTALKELDVRGNQRRLPPLTIVRKGCAAVRDYLRDWSAKEAQAAADRAAKEAQAAAVRAAKEAKAAADRAAKEAKAAAEADNEKVMHAATMYCGKEKKHVNILTDELLQSTLDRLRLSSSAPQLILHRPFNNWDEVTAKCKGVGPDKTCKLFAHLSVSENDEVRALHKFRETRGGLSWSEATTDWLKDCNAEVRKDLIDKEKSVSASKKKEAKRKREEKGRAAKEAAEQQPSSSQRKSQRGTSDDAALSNVLVTSARVSPGCFGADPTTWLRIEPTGDFFEYGARGARTSRKAAPVEDKAAWLKAVLQRAGWESPKYGYLPDRAAGWCLGPDEEEQMWVKVDGSWGHLKDSTIDVNRRNDLPGHKVALPVQIKPRGETKHLYPWFVTFG